MFKYYILIKLMSNQVLKSLSQLSCNAVKRDHAGNKYRLRLYLHHLTKLARYFAEIKVNFACHSLRENMSSIYCHKSRTTQNLYCERISLVAYGFSSDLICEFLKSPVNWHSSVKTHLRKIRRFRVIHLLKFILWSSTPAFRLSTSCTW